MANEPTEGREALSDEDMALLSEEGVDIEAMDEADAEEAAVEEAKPAEPAKAEQQEAEADPDEGGGDVPKGYVPVKTHTSLRQERNELRDKLNEMSAIQARIAERLAETRGQRQEPQEEDSDLPPDPNEDPMAFLNWQRQQAIEGRQRQQQYTEQQQHIQQQNAVWQQITQTAVHDFNEAEKADPAVTEAFDYTRQVFVDQAKASGMPDQYIPKYVEDSIRGFAANYVQHIRPQGISMADHVKQVAMAYRWQPSTQEPGQQQASAVEKIQTQAKAQKASGTLSKGGASNGELTLEAVNAMSAEDLEKLAEDPEAFAIFGVPA